MKRAKRKKQDELRPGYERADFPKGHTRGKVGQPMVPGPSIGAGAGMPPSVRVAYSGTYRATRCRQSMFKAKERECRRVSGRISIHDVAVAAKKVRWLA